MRHAAARFFAVGSVVRAIRLRQERVKEYPNALSFPIGQNFVSVFEKKEDYLVVELTTWRRMGARVLQYLN